MKFLASVFLFLLVNPLWATKQVAYSKRVVDLQKWEVVDILFKGKASDTPFEVDFQAQFINPAGKKQTVSGFYNGNKQYIIRFSANMAGEWTYTTSSSLRRLHGKTGKIMVAEQAYRQTHGALRVDTSQQHFVYEDGKPYFLTGFEMDWLFALDYGKEKASVAENFLNEVAENGFNHVITNVYAYDIKWKRDSSIRPEHDFGRPLFFPFGGDNQQPDFSTLNIEFFKHFDRVVERLNAREIIAHLMIYVWNKKVNWPPMYSQADNRYFDYIIKRYQAYPNVVWDISKEALAYGRCDAKYLKERIARARQLDSYKRLLTVHSFGFCKTNPALVDFISVQAWTSNLHQFMAKEQKRFINKPLFNIEHGGYERGPYKVFAGNYDRPESCLHRNYQCAFAGTYSTYYWQGCSWSIIVPQPNSLPQAVRPRFDYYKHFTRFFAEHPLTEYKPANISMSGWGLNNEKKNKYLVLCPAANSSVTMRLPKTDKGIAIKWFNPLTGEYTQTKTEAWTTYLWAYPPVQGQDWIVVAEVL